jgi:hypothetical protein
MTLDRVSNIGNVEISEKQIRSALLEASLRLQTHGRADGSPHPVYEAGLIDRWRSRWDSLALGDLQTRSDGRWKPDAEMRADAMRAYSEGRVDAALAPGPAGFLRDFDYIHREILEEVRPQLNSGLLFPMDTSVPLGASTHTARRATVAGRARWHNQGTTFPIAKAGYQEETFGTGFVVCAVEQSFFEGLHIGFAGLQTYRIEADGAIRAIEEFLNNVAFYGDKARNIYGALTYPDLAKYIVPTRFGAGSTGLQVATALNLIANTPMVTSRGTFRPNRIVTSEAVRAYLGTTPLDTAGGTTTILRYFLEGQGPNGIRDIEVAHELSAAEMTANNVGNPAGYHGIFAYRDDRRSIAHVMPQRPTFLPIWRSSPIDTIHVAFAQTGGVTMHDVGNNLLAFVRI